MTRIKHILFFIIFIFSLWSLNFGFASAAGEGWELEVSLPGLKAGTAIKDPGQYFEAVYKFAVALGAILAVVMIIYGGFIWMTSPAIDSVAKGKGMITGAIYGLILLLASYLILYTINPELTGLNSPELGDINIDVNNSGGTGAGAGAGGSGAGGGGNGGGGEIPSDADANGRRVLEEARQYQGHCADCYKTAREVYNRAGMEPVAVDWDPQTGWHHNRISIQPQPGYILDLDLNGDGKEDHTVIFDHEEIINGQRVWRFWGADASTDWQYTDLSPSPGSPNSRVPWSPDTEGLPIHMWRPVYQVR